MMNQSRNIPFGAAVSVLVFFSVNLMSPENLSAQAGGDVSFARNDKVLEWKTVNSGGFTLSERMRLNFDSDLSSSLNMTSGSGMKDRWYDSVMNKAEIDYTVSDKITMEFSAKEDWNRDTLSRFGKSLITTSADSKVIYRPSNSVDISGGIGTLYDRRFENEDRGTNFNGQMTYDGNPADNMSALLSLNGATSTLKRSNDLVNLDGLLSYDSRPGTLTLGFGEAHRNRGYFSDIDRKGIEERSRIERNLSLLFERGSFYNYREKTAFAVSMDLGTKRVDDSANDNEQSSKYKKNSQGIVRSISFNVARGIGKRILARYEGEYRHDKNDVELAVRSREQKDISMRGDLGIGVGHADSLMVTGWIKRTRIDTPKGVSNDRDELKIGGGANYIRYFSDNFKTVLDFRVLETHYVNIDASQSSQNKWIKTYQLSPSLVYSPMQTVRLSHTVNLFANHMDYDFDSDVNPRSNITRRVSSESSLDTELSDRTRVTLGMMFEQNDYGNLNSDNYKLPVEEGIRRFGNIAVEYELAEWITLKPLYMYAIRRDTDIDRNKIIRREVDQTYGINCSMFKNTTGDYSLEISIKRIVRKTEKYLRIRDYITMNMKYGF